MKRIVPFFLLIGFACTTVDPVSNCTSEVSPEKWTSLDQVQLQADIEKIDNYLAANSITAVEHPSGVRYVITQFGSGENVPCLQSAISISYEGRILGNGSLFDSSASPVAFILDRLIAGWQIAFLEFNKGTKATIYIPSGLGYGTNDNLTSIPPNSTLVFQIELHDFR